VPTTAGAKPAPIALGAGPPRPHPLDDPQYQLHLKRARQGGFIVGAGIAIVAAGTGLLIAGMKRDHPEPLCQTFHWTDLILDCEEYETQAEFDERVQKATRLKAGGVGGLLLGTAALGAGIGLIVKHRRLRDRRLQEIFGPVQGLNLAPTPDRRGLSLGVELRF
jgi:hypothetical protein